MPYRIPPAKNYSSPLVAIPSRLLNEPAEGRQSIPCEIAWVAQGSATPDFAVTFNFANNATLNISQMCAIKVDNSQCGSDIVFIFPDTNDTLTVPAYLPATVFPIFTNRQDFVARALGPIVLENDVTRFNILNFLPPPVVMPTTQEQNAVSANTIVWDGATTTQLIPVTVSGTLETIQILATNLSAVEDFHYLMALTDSAGNVMPSVQVDLKTAQQFTGIVMNFPMCHIRFDRGVKLVQTRTIGTVAEGFLSANLLYRTP